ncbi:hypothetical protein KSS87_000230, partial [Heliosperma pusillum]
MHSKVDIRRVLDNEYVYKIFIVIKIIVKLVWK